MIKPFEKVLLYLFLFLTLTGYAAHLHAREQGDTLAAALTEARKAGIPETKLNQLLALGYEKQFEPSSMAALVSILAQCQQENLPLQPFLSKIEEGISKRVPAPRIEQLLMSKQEDYRFTRLLIDEAVKRQGRDEALSPELQVRLTETLYCGLSREDLNRLMEAAPAAPLAVVARSAEVLAALRQMRFDPQYSEQIVNAGLKQGFFGEDQKDFSRVIAAARGKGLQDEEISRVALAVISSRSPQNEFCSRLGITAEDVSSRGPHVGRGHGLGGSKAENIGGPLGAGRGLGHGIGGPGSRGGPGGAPGSGPGSGPGGGGGPGGGPGGGGGSGGGPGGGGSGGGGGGPGGGGK